MRNRLIFILLATFMVSCSSPESTAKKELNSRQCQFTITDFLHAAGKGDLQILALFGKAGIDVNATNEVGRTALMEASGKGKLSGVELLLGAGANPRMIDVKGRDALISASAGGHTEIARLLLSRGAESRVRDEAGWTALTIAAFKGKPETVRLLAGQSPQENLDEALLLGSLNGNRETVSNLISQGAFVDARSPENFTPLMIAAKNGYYEVASLLLQNKSDHLSLAPDGKNAAIIAKEAGHHNIHRLILDGGHGTSIENEDAIRAATISAQSRRTPVLRAGETKPLVALNGSKIRTLTSKTSALNYFKVAAYEERELPVALKDVDGVYATITRVDPNGIASDVKVAKSDLIPGTSFRLQEIEPKKVRSNGLPENTIDTARVRIQHIKTKANYLLVKDAKTKPVDSYAILTANNSDYRYVAKTGDIFQVVDPDNGELDYQVVAVGESDVAVKELASAKIVRVSRSAGM